MIYALFVFISCLVSFAILIGIVVAMFVFLPLWLAIPIFILMLIPFD